MRCQKIIGASLALWLVGTYPAFGEAPDAVTPDARLRGITCPWNMPPGEEIYCGLFKVPLSRSTDTGRTIEIFFALVPSLSEDPTDDPVLLINGGPGSAWENPTPAALRDLSAIRTGRYLILADQRGTARGNPNLSCDDFTKSESTEAAYQPILRCIEAWRRKGIDPSYFTSTETAADFKELRIALKVPRWHIYGSSYGTVVAQLLMRTDKAGTGRVILDSAASVEPVRLSRRVMGYRLNLIQRAGHDCWTQEHCGRAYRDVFESFRTAFVALEKSPVSLERNPSRWYSGREFVHHILDLIEEPGGLRHLPFRIDEIAKHVSGEKRLDDYVFYRRAIQMPREDFGRSDERGSAAVYWAAMCVEQWSPEVASDWRHGNEDGPIPLRYFFRMNPDALDQICKEFRFSPLEGPYLDNKSSPILFLSGAYDVATPIESVREVASKYRDAEIVTFEHLTHGVAFESACSIFVLSAFLNEPDKPLDRGCLRFHEKPRFWVFRQ